MLTISGSNALQVFVYSVMSASRPLWTLRFVPSQSFSASEELVRCWSSTRGRVLLCWAFNKDILKIQESFYQCSQQHTNSTNVLDLSSPSPIRKGHLSDHVLPSFCPPVSPFVRRFQHGSHRTDFGIILNWKLS